ncbi:MAG: CmcI family methyltransferase [Pseudomonadota bacterium]
MFGLGLKAKAKSLGEQLQMMAQHGARPRLVGNRSEDRIGVVFSEPHDMPLGDRILLYGLIRGLKPEAVLEIGVRWGGSARIIAAAMEANGRGAIVGLDPDLSNFRPHASELFGRYHLVEGYSPDDTEKALAKIGGMTDLVFIDAVHTYAAVKEDFRGVYEHLKPGAHILFHDAFHQGVQQAVQDVLAEYDGLTDLGMMSRNATSEPPLSYSGLHMVRFGETAFETLLTDAHARNGAEPPDIDEKYWNYDLYANRIGNALGRPDKTDG